MLTKIRGNKVKFIIAIIVIILIVINMFGIKSFFSPSHLRDQVLAFGTIAPLIFITIYSIATIFFLPGTPLTISGGLIFGKWLGTLYTVIGATIGATIAFLVARYLGESFVEDILKGKHKKIYEYDKKLEKNGFLIVLFLRLVPIFPFNGLNFALGLTKVRTRDYILGTLIGIIPGSFALAFFGDSIAELNPVNIALAISFFVLLAITPTIYRRFRKRYKGKTS